MKKIDSSFRSNKELKYKKEKSKEYITGITKILLEKYKPEKVLVSLNDQSESTDDNQVN